MSRHAQLPDGTVLEFPDNTPDSVIDGVARQHIAASNAPAMAQTAMNAFRGIVTPPPSQTGSTVGGMTGRGINRAVTQAAAAHPPLVPERYTRGLAEGTGSMVEGATNFFAPVINPIGQTLYNVGGYGDQTYDAGKIAREALGLPKNENPLADKAIQFGTGAVTGGGVFNAASKAANPGLWNNVLASMAGNPVVNAAGGAGAGYGTQKAQDAGFGPLGQFGAGMLGALVAGGAASRIAPGPVIPTTPSLPRPTAQTIPQQVVEAGKAFNVPVYTSDLRPPSTAMGKWFQGINEKIPLAGTGGMRAGQQAARRTAVKQLLSDYGGEDSNVLFDSAPRAIDGIASDLATRRGAQLTRLTAQRDAALRAVPGPVPVPNATAALDTQIARLQGLRTNAAMAVAAKLQNWRQAIQGQDIHAINTIRKEMGEAFTADNLGEIKSTGQGAVNAIYGPIKQDMGNAIESSAGPAVRNRWATANDQLSAMAGELQDKAFARVLRTTEMTPENVGKMLFSKDRSTVQRLWGNLGPVGQERARAAVVQKAFDNAIRSDSGLSPDAFRTNLKALSENIGVAFDGPDAARIEGFTRLLDHTQRAAQAGVMPPTGAQNTPTLVAWGLGTLFKGAAIPVAGASGLMARIYESGPVRNALVGLGRAAPGSVAEQRSLTNVLLLVSPILQREIGAIGNPANDLSGVWGSRVGVPAAAGNRQENQQKQNRPFRY